MVNSFEAFSTPHQETVDAFQQFYKTLAAGFQELSEQCMSLTKSSIDLHVEKAKAAMSVKDPKEFVEMHSDWANQVCGAALMGSIKLSELTKKISAEASAPLQSHFASSFGKMTNNSFNMKTKF